MGIDSLTQDRYTRGIVSTIEDSSEPLKVPQLLSKIQSANTSFEKEVTVALLWHLLATHKLQFDEARRIKLPR
jgi:hypothetical protein